MKIVAGNTGIGIYKNEEPFAAYVCLKGVKELSEIKVRYQAQDIKLFSLQNISLYQLH